MVYSSGIDVAFLGSANGRAYRYSVTLDTRLKCRRVGSWYKGNVNFRSNNVWVREFDARTTNTTTCMNRTDIGMISRATCVRLMYLVCVHSPRGCACRVHQYVYTEARQRRRRRVQTRICVCLNERVCLLPLSAFIYERLAARHVYVSKSIFGVTRL